MKTNRTLTSHEKIRETRVRFVMASKIKDASLLDKKLKDRRKALYQSGKIIFQNVYEYE